MDTLTPEQSRLAAQLVGAMLSQATDSANRRAIAVGLLKLAAGALVFSEGGPAAAELIYQEGDAAASKPPE